MADYREDITAAINGLASEKFIDRLFSRDASVWKDEQAEKDIIANALGWLDLPLKQTKDLDVVTAFAEEIKKDGFTDVVLLGMGGSSLAPFVLSESLGTAKGFPRLTVLDSTDPDAIRAVEDRVDLKKTLFIVASKSGSTIEPQTLFAYFHERLIDLVGDAARLNFIAITDAGSMLEAQSKDLHLRCCFVNPSDIGGRFSALSYFGLVPAALIGIDIIKLVGSARAMYDASIPTVPINNNSGFVLGASLGVLAKKGKDKLTFFTSLELSSFGLWLEQLIAESTGKEGRGIVPVSGEEILPPGAYGQDRVFVHIGCGATDLKTETSLKALQVAGHPVIRIGMKDIYGIGAEFFRWEIVTATAGRVLGINPFSQPDVESAKKLARARLNESDGDAVVEKMEQAPPGAVFEWHGLKVCFPASTFAKIKSSNGAADAVRLMSKFIGTIKDDDYIGLLTYFSPFDEKTGRFLKDIKANLRGLGKSAVQFGYGPRYLHSTGQLHKGGLPNGVFFVLCHRTKNDVEIPDKSFTFSELELSQAFGDVEALEARGFRAVLIIAEDSKRASVIEMKDFIAASVVAARA